MKGIGLIMLLLLTLASTVARGQQILQEKIYEIRNASPRAFGKLPFGYGYSLRLPNINGTGERAAVLFLNDNLDTLSFYYQNRGSDISFPPLAIDSFSAMVVTDESNFSAIGTMFTQVHKFGFVMGNVLQLGSQTTFLITCGIKRPDKGFLVCGAKTIGLNPTRVANFRIWTDSLGVQERQDSVQDFGGRARADRIYHRPGGGYYLIGTKNTFGWVKELDATGRTLDSTVLYRKVNPPRDITANFFAEPAPGGGFLYSVTYQSGSNYRFEYGFTKNGSKIWSDSGDFIIMPPRISTDTTAIIYHTDGQNSTPQYGPVMKRIHVPTGRVIWQQLFQGGQWPGIRKAISQYDYDGQGNFVMAGSMLSPITGVYALYLARVGNVGFPFNPATNLPPHDKREVIRLSAYPNPFSNGNLTLDYEGQGDVKVFSSAGQLVHTALSHQGGTVLSLPPLPAGVYSVMVRVGGSVRWVRVVRG